MGPRTGGEAESVSVIGEPGRLRRPGVAGADLGADILVLVFGIESTGTVDDDVDERES